MYSVSLGAIPSLADNVIVNPHNRRLILCGKLVLCHVCLFLNRLHYSVLFVSKPEAGMTRVPLRGLSEFFLVSD